MIRSILILQKQHQEYQERLEREASEHRPSNSAIVAGGEVRPNVASTSLHSATAPPPYIEPHKLNFNPSDISRGQVAAQGQEPNANEGEQHTSNDARVDEAAQEIQPIPALGSSKTTSDVSGTKLSDHIKSEDDVDNANDNGSNEVYFPMLRMYSMDPEMFLSEYDRSISVNWRCQLAPMPESDLSQRLVQVYNQGRWSLSLVMGDLQAYERALVYQEIQADYGSLMDQEILHMRRTTQDLWLGSLQLKDVPSFHFIVQGVKRSDQGAELNNDNNITPRTRMAPPPPAPRRAAGPPDTTDYVDEDIMLIPKLKPEMNDLPVEALTHGYDSPALSSDDEDGDENETDAIADLIKKYTTIR